jgi:hypothetical protein
MIGFLLAKILIAVAGKLTVVFYYGKLQVQLTRFPNSHRMVRVPHKG